MVRLLVSQLFVGFGSVMGGLALIALIFACAPTPVRDYPHGPRCAQDGVHRHADTTGGAR